MAIAKITLRDADELVLGWVYRETVTVGAHPDCRRAIEAGRIFHAIPAGFAKTLPEYHFASWDEAIDALS